MGPDGRLSAETRPAYASDSDREYAAGVIKAAFLEGRLDHDEYAERTRRARGSGTCSELAGLTADLPAALPPNTGSAVGPATGAVPATVGAAGSFDLAAVILCVLSVSLGVVFIENPVSPLTLLASIILGACASVRVQRGPTWERITVWGTSGVLGGAVVLVIAAFFL
jgi:hypothetical protein